MTALTEITSTNTRVSAQTDAYERISGLFLQPHKRIHVLALTGIRVVTQDFRRKSKQILFFTQVVRMSGRS
jgi:hypothetical protein